MKDQNDLTQMEAVLFDGEITSKKADLYLGLVEKYNSDSVFKKQVTENTKEVLILMGFELMEDVTYKVISNDTEIPPANANDRIVYLNLTMKNDDSDSEITELLEDSFSSVAGGGIKDWFLDKIKNELLPKPLCAYGVNFPPRVGK